MRLFCYSCHSTCRWQIYKSSFEPLEVIFTRDYSAGYDNRREGWVLQKYSQFAQFFSPILLDSEIGKALSRTIAVLIFFSIWLHARNWSSFQHKPSKSTPCIFFASRKGIPYYTNQSQLIQEIGFFQTSSGLLWRGNCLQTPSPWCCWWGSTQPARQPS